MNVALDKLQEIGLGFIQGQTIGLVASGLATGYGLFKSGQALRARKLSKNRAIFGTTTYSHVQEGEQSFVDQRLRTVDFPINVNEIFDPAIRRIVIYYLNKAKKHCTEDEPIIFTHLDKVMSKKQYKRIMPLIKKDWINYFSPLMRQVYGVAAPRLQPNQTAEEFTVLPLLIFEPNAPYKQFKIMPVDLDLFLESIPEDESDLRVEVNGTMITEDHYLRERWDTSKALANSVYKSREFLIGFGVAVPTGKIITHQLTPQVSPQ